MSDPVAAKSTFLCMYMSNHPDTLVSYVKHFGKISDSTISGAQMTSIDSNGMTLSYQSKSGKSQVRVEFDPPLLGYDEVKPRLLSMKADAEESLGMTPAPQINKFYVSKTWLPVLICAAAFAYITLSPSSTTGIPSYWLPGSYMHNYLGGMPTFKLIWTITFAVHSLEAFYTLILVRRHKTGFLLGAAYCFSTVLLGIPVWSEIRKRVQKARIDSIMKDK